MAAKMSVLGLILYVPSYLRSANGQFPLAQKEDEGEEDEGGG